MHCIKCAVLYTMGFVQNWDYLHDLQISKVNLHHEQMHTLLKKIIQKATAKETANTANTQ